MFFLQERPSEVARRETRLGEIRSTPVQRARGNRVWDFQPPGQANLMKRSDWSGEFVAWASRTRPTLQGKRLDASAAGIAGNLRLAYTPRPVRQGP